MRYTKKPWDLTVPKKSPVDALGVRAHVPCAAVWADDHRAPFGQLLVARISVQIGQAPAPVGVRTELTGNALLMRGAAEMYEALGEIASLKIGRSRDQQAQAAHIAKDIAREARERVEHALDRVVTIERAY